MNRAGLFFITLLLILLAGSAWTQSAGTSSFDPARDTIPPPLRKLVVSNSHSWPPFSYLDKHNQPQGMLIDFWKFWAEKTGVEVQFNLVEWNSGIERLRTAEADIHAGLLLTEERDKVLDFSREIFPLTTHLFLSSNLQANDFNDLKDIAVGVVSGSYEEEYMRSAHPLIRLELFNDPDVMINAAAQDRISAFVGDYPVAIFYLHHYEAEENFRILTTCYSKTIHGAVTEGNQELLSLINAGFQKIPAEEKERIFQKWLRSESKLPRWLIPAVILGFALLSLIGLFMHNSVLRREVQEKTSELSRSYEKIQRERNRAQNYLDIAGVILVGMDLEQKVIMINRKGIEVLGYPEAEILGRNWLQVFVPEQERARVSELFRRIVSGEGKVFEKFENRLVTRIGATRVFSWQNSLLLDDSGKVVGSLSSGEDVTERKRLEEKEKAAAIAGAMAEQERKKSMEMKAINTALEKEINVHKQTKASLKRTEEEFRSIFENAPLGIFQSTPDGKFIRVNPAMAAMMGYGSPEELIETVNRATISEVLYENPTSKPLYLKAAGEKSPWQISENRYRCKDGRIITGLLSFRSFFNTETGRNELEGFVEDITDRKQSDEKLRENEERFRTVADFTYDWEYWIGPDRKFRYISPSCERITGYTSKEFMDDPSLLIRCVHPDDRARFCEHLENQFDSATQKLCQTEFRIYERHGGERWIEQISHPVYGADFHWLGRRGSNRDITKRKEVEAELNRYRANLENLVQARTDELEKKTRELQNERNKAHNYLDMAGVVLVAIDADQKLTMINRKGEEVFGFREDQILGKNWFDTFLPEGLRAQARDTFLKVMSGAMVPVGYFEHGILVQSGEIRTFAWHNRFVQGENGQFVEMLSSGEDITERKRISKVKTMTQFRLNALLELNNMMEVPDDELIQFALEEGVKLTESKIGYVGILKDNETVLSMLTWSKSTLEGCQIPEKKFQFKVSDLNLLAEPIRQRKPIVTDRFAPPSRMPPGHVPVSNYLSLPIFDGDEIVLVAGVGNKTQSYDRNDVDQLNLLMTGVWQLLQRKRLTRELEETRIQEIEYASQIQQTLLMGQVPRNIRDARIVALTIPSQMIDGDFYDFYSYNRFCFDFFIGDVMGKGIPAGLVGAAVKSQFQRTLSRLISTGRRDRLPEVDGIVSRVHSEMTPLLSKLGMFVSMHFGRIDLKRQELCLVNLGHTPLIHFHAERNECRLVGGSNMPLGLSDTENYSQVRIPFVDGDKFIFFSDGITDARNTGKELFGIDRLLEQINLNSRLNPQELINAIQREVTSFVGSNSFSDDLTLLIISIEPGNDKDGKTAHERQI